MVVSAIPVWGANRFLMVHGIVAAFILTGLSVVYFVPGGWPYALRWGSTGAIESQPVG